MLAGWKAEKVGRRYVMISPRAAAGYRLACENAEVIVFSETLMQTTQSIETPQPTVISTVTPCRDWTLILPRVAAERRQAVKGN